jgi:hypothetical protein
MPRNKRKDKQAQVIPINFAYYHGWETEHKQVMIYPAATHPTLGVEVDEDIAELITHLWRHGFHTVGSCQDLEDTGRAYVSFATYDEAQRFIAQTKDLGSERLRISAQALADAPPRDQTHRDAVTVTFPAIVLPLVTKLFA